MEERKIVVGGRAKKGRLLGLVPKTDPLKVLFSIEYLSFCVGVEVVVLLARRLKTLV